MKPLEPLLPGETRSEYLDRLERQDRIDGAVAQEVIQGLRCQGFEIIRAAVMPPEMFVAIRAWMECPVEKRPSPQALGQRIADIASALSE